MTIELIVFKTGLSGWIFFIFWFLLFRREKIIEELYSVWNNRRLIGGCLYSLVLALGLFLKRFPSLDISDKYQVCAHFHSARSRAGFAGFWKFVKHRFHTLVLVDGAAKKLCLFAALLVGRVRSRATACKMRLQERWCEHTVDLCSERHGCCCRVHYGEARMTTMLQSPERHGCCCRVHY